MWMDNLSISAARMDAIFQPFADLLFIIDKDGLILDYKAGDIQHVFTLLEYFPGKRMQDVLPPEAGQKFSNALQKIKDGQFTSTLEYGQSIGGQTRWFEASLVPSPQNQIIVMVRDITRPKEAEERNQRNLKRLEALHTIDLAIASSMDLNLALSLVLKQVTNQLNVDAADILLYAAQKNTLEFAQGVGFRTEALRHTHLSMGEGYAGMAALKREMISVPNLAYGKAGFVKSPNFSEEGFLSYYGLPLIAKGQVRGVMELFHRSVLSPDAEWLNFMKTLADQTAIAVENAILFKELQRTNFELNLAYNTTIEGWSRALDLRDRDTKGHTQRVTDLALKLARRLDLTESELIHIRRGAVLHDIGKMAIPDRILLKPGPLTADEWEIIRQHPRFAVELLTPMSHLGPALDIPHYHHEKWDGTGYPHGLRENQIPLSARLFAVADVYDALTSERPYRPAWTKDKAFAYIRDQAGKHFDPAIAMEFLSMIEAREE